jgi:hypothetical protein
MDQTTYYLVRAGFYREGATKTYLFSSLEQAEDAIVKLHEHAATFDYHYLTKVNLNPALDAEGNEIVAK